MNPGKRLKTADAILVADRGQKTAILSVDNANDGFPVLLVDGVAYGAPDLPAGAYLLVGDADMADRAALAGFVTATPGSVKRRVYVTTGKVMGVGLLVCAGMSLYWAVRDLLEVDLLGVLVAVGLALFLGLLGIFYWFYGGATMLDEEAAQTSKVARARRTFRSFIRRR